ncbi:MAG: hypothetical protein AB1Z22_09350 [Synechococcaceae cyanobacterium]
MDALDRFRRGGDLADQLILARATSAGALLVLSFDRRFSASEGVELLQPGCPANTCCRWEASRFAVVLLSVRRWPSPALAPLIGKAKACYRAIKDASGWIQGAAPDQGKRRVSPDLP